MASGTYDLVHALALIVIQFVEAEQLGEAEDYSWKVEGGALLDTYDFDVNPKTGRITSKMRL